MFLRGDVKHRCFYVGVYRSGEAPKYKSLRTTDRDAAIPKALEFASQIKEGANCLPVTRKKRFAAVAQEFLADEMKRTELPGRAGITAKRVGVQKTHIERHLLAFCGDKGIAEIGSDEWRSYSAWRYGKAREAAGKLPSGHTVRVEMETFRRVMQYAFERNYIKDSPHKLGFDNRYLLAKERGEGLSLLEYTKLVRYMPKWVGERSIGEDKRWTRQVTRYMLLIAANTGMRTSEMRNLKWKDIAYNGSTGRAEIRVSGKGKMRVFGAKYSVWRYLMRIKAISTKNSMTIMYSKLRRKSMQKFV